MALFLFFLMLLSYSTLHCAATAASASTELSVLLGLKSSLGISDSNPQFKSWTPSTPPCNFSFITCSPSAAITAIDLTSTGITGTIPFLSICTLPSLARLSLGSNGLRGLVSPDIRNCTALRHLDLASNFLSGPLPDLSLLSELRVLNLSGNAFTGAIPARSLRNLTSLEALLLGDNSFNPSPFPPEILGLRNLNWLYLSNCSIQGQIPRGIGNLTGLINLELADNSLHGEIPREIAALAGLWQLELYDNWLVGTLPTGLGNLTELAYFDASSNLLEGGLGEIRRLRSLISLQLFENNFTGTVPGELGEFPSLVNLSLYSNQLSGELPRSLGSSAEFYFIDVSSNRLTGPIPPDMCRRGTMEMLLMLENQFTGGIPGEYGRCRTLTRLRVSDNRLSGEVPPAIWALPELRIIDLARNQLEGAIGEGISGARALTQLFLAGNGFSGRIPAGIGGAGGLVAVDLSLNGFSGEIPPEIGRLWRLNSLLLHHNQLSGAIPRELGACVALNELDASTNRLEGGIPAALGALPVLNSLNLSHNHLSGEIPAALGSLKLSSLDLSNNDLTGPVPVQLAYAGSFGGNPGLCADAGVLPRCAAGSSEGLRRAIVGVAIVVGLLAAAVAAGLAVRRRWGKGRRCGMWTVRSFRMLEFDEREIAGGIREENVIGKGASGSVYRVKLGGGETVAVKHLKGGRARQQLAAEVAVLGEIRHTNVVKLYCSITNEDGSLLVYEYLPKGSLWDRLHGGGEGLEWRRRFEVALGAAKGLEHLHHGCGRAVVHRDVKSSNILLDEVFGARIADFGLAREVDDGREEAGGNTLAGTHGYMCPEYAYTNRVTEKSDIYSFGVVLMELVTGKRPVEPEFGEDKDITHWILKKLGAGEDARSFLDPTIPKEFDDEAMDVLKVAIHCTMKLPSLRPSMRRVVHMLEDAAQWRSGMPHGEEMDLEKGDGQFYQLKRETSRGSGDGCMGTTDTDSCRCK